MKKQKKEPEFSVESEVQERPRTPTKASAIRKAKAEKVPEEHIGVIHKPTIKSFRDLENNVKQSGITQNGSNVHGLLAESDQSGL